MEQVNISDIEEFQTRKVIKNIPIVTRDLIISVLFFDKKIDSLALKEQTNDRVFYVIRGSGSVSSLDIDQIVSEGSLILIPGSEDFYISTNEDRMVILIIRSIDNLDN